MWGNLRGWIVSAMMLLVTGGGLIILAMPPSETRWDKLVPLAFKPATLPVNPDTVKPAGTTDGDAGDLYKQAIDQYLQNPKQYESLARADLSTAAKLPGVDLVKRAANLSRMRLFEINPTQAINYEPKKPWIDALMGLGQAVCDVGLSYKGSGKPKEATEYYEAAFALGRKLFDERVSWDEMNRGLSVMMMAAESMARMAEDTKDDARHDTMEQFNEKTQQYRDDLQQKVATPLCNPVEVPLVNDPSNNFGAKYAGDVFAIAKDPTADRVWRVEAILHMGHYKYNVAPGHAGDQFWAGKELAALAASTDPKNTDPVIHTAVLAAENLTLEQHHNTGQ
jgi:hypothetical protein